MAQPDVWYSHKNEVWYARLKVSTKPTLGLMDIGASLICLESGTLFKWDGEKWIGMGATE